MSISTLALQTWTIRELLRANPVKTLQQVREIGFEYLELAGNAGKSPAEFSQLCRDHGFTVIGVHQPPLTTGDLTDLLDETMEACEVHKCSFATVMLEPEERSDQESYFEYADLASKAAQTLGERDIILYFHCYPQDLREIDGPEGSKSGLDILLERTSAEELRFQLDTYFLFKACMSIETYLEKCGSRCRMLHLNDIDAEDKQAILGKGRIPWAKLLKSVQQASSPEWYMLEHNCADPLHWIRESYSYWREHIASP